MDWQPLNSRQRDILASLATNAPQSGRELSRGLDIEYSTIERNLGTLRDEGLVTGNRDHSQRGAPVANRLTTEGQRLVHEGIVRKAEAIMDADLEG